MPFDLQYFVPNQVDEDEYFFAYVYHRHVLFSAVVPGTLPCICPTPVLPSLRRAGLEAFGLEFVQGYRLEVLVLIKVNSKVQT